MDSISFKAAFGYHQKTVELTNVGGAGGKHIHLYLDRYYNGAFHYTTQYGWLYGGDSLETADIYILIEMIVDKWSDDN